MKKFILFITEKIQKNRSVIFLALLVAVIIPLCLSGDGLIFEPEPEIVDASIELPFPEPEPEPLPQQGPKIFTPDKALSPEQVIEEYFRQQYISYTSLEYIDISALMDTSLSRMRNTLAWMELLMQRRRLIAENELCYVDTEMLPYEIIYINAEDIKDERISFWREANISFDGENMLHFTIKGTPGGVYPPMMAVNTQHSIILKQVDGEWKITFHYFPGSVRKFRWLQPLDIPSDEEATALLLEEFRVDLLDMSDIAIPDGALAYDGLLSAEYARQYTERPNPNFYNIGDWMGNCANFTSQCIWYGFAGEENRSSAMTSLWYAGEGGGSPAWENVSHFWDYATGGNGLAGQELAGISQLVPGDLIQTRARDFESDDPERYNHSLILVDKEKLIFAQNSPGAFVYYSDMVNIEARYLRPIAIRQ